MEQDLKPVPQASKLVLTSIGPLNPSHDVICRWAMKLKLYIGSGFLKRSEFSAKLTEIVRNNKVETSTEHNILHNDSPNLRCLYPPAVIVVNSWQILRPMEAMKTPAQRVYI